MKRTFKKKSKDDGNLGDSKFSGSEVSTNNTRKSYPSSNNRNTAVNPGGGMKIDYLNSIYPLSKPYPTMKHIHASNLNPTVPKILLRAISTDMYNAAKLYNVRYSVDFTLEQIEEYIMSGLRLANVVNYMMFYLSTTDQEYLQDLSAQMFRPEILVRANDILGSMFMPKDIVDLFIKLSAPVQLGPLEIYTITHHISESDIISHHSNIVNKLNHYINEAVIQLNLSNIFSTLYPSVKVGLTIHRDPRKISFWVNKMVEQIHSIDEQEGDKWGSKLVKYPRQFEELAKIGYPVYWFDMFEESKITDIRSVINTQQEIPQLMSADWIDLGTEDLFWNDSIIMGNLLELGHNIGRINQSVPFGLISRPRTDKSIPIPNRNR